jgi:multidrug efflux pump subunit AcrB
VICSNGDTIALSKLATIELVNGPSGVYRVDMYPAVRLIGLPPKGKTSESTASQCTQLADAERKSQKDSDSLEVLNLTGH